MCYFHNVYTTVQYVQFSPFIWMSTLLIVEVNDEHAFPLLLVHPALLGSRVLTQREYKVDCKFTDRVLILMLRQARLAADVGGFDTGEAHSTGHITERAGIPD